MADMLLLDASSRWLGLSVSDFADIATIIGSLAAVYGVVWSARSFRQSVQLSRLQTSAGIIQSMKQQYEGDSCKESRRRLARILEAPATGDSTEGPRLATKAYEVLEIFEQLGHLVKRGVLDEGMAWSAFSWDVIRYDYALRKGERGDEIQRARAESGQRTLYCDFEELASRLTAFGVRESSGHKRDLVWSEILDFLRTEQEMK